MAGQQKRVLASAQPKCGTIFTDHLLTQRFGALMDNVTADTEGKLRAACWRLLKEFGPDTQYEVLRFLCRRLARLEGGECFGHKRIIFANLCAGSFDPAYLNPKGLTCAFGCAFLERNLDFVLSACSALDIDCRHLLSLVVYAYYYASTRVHVETKRWLVSKILLFKKTSCQREFRVAVSLYKLAGQHKMKELDNVLATANEDSISLACTLLAFCDEPEGDQVILEKLLYDKKLGMNDAAFAIILSFVEEAGNAKRRMVVTRAYTDRLLQQLY